MKFCRFVLVCALAVCCVSSAVAQVAGQNINMVSGTDFPVGDPYLQRQNEPSMAVSSRNPEHLVGGANDYRTVDIPIPNAQAPTILGDAWLGVYSSLDGGETWKSTLLPGYPQDTSSVGMSSPLHAYSVATDPTVRAGTHGLFYYSGLVFNRTPGSPSGVFVATFQDMNNKGNGDWPILTTTNGTIHGNPISYIGASIVDSGNSGQFLDKPWIAVDIPRPGRTATCKINGQTILSGYVYVVYTQFNGSQNNPSSKIKEVTSTNCGATWSQPEILSQSQKLAQGTVAAIDPTNGNVFVAWRQIAVTGKQNQPDAIQWALSTNGGTSFTYNPAIFTFTAPTTNNPYPAGAVFDQPQATTTTFRTLDVPTVAIDASGTTWVAFSERVNGPTPGTYGSRIMLTTLLEGGSTWTTPFVADKSVSSKTYGHQFMPSLNFAYGKLALAWFDSRRDNLESVLSCASGSCADLSMLAKGDQPLPGSSIANPASVFTPLISDTGSSTNQGVRHTIDVFGTVIDPSLGPMPTPGFQISLYPYYVDDGNGQIEQGFFNPPNLPMFVQGTTPFIGDYIDIAAQNILPTLSNGTTSWIFNTQGKDSITGATNAPDFHVTWTDNRDVVPPPVVNGIQDWTQYVPPNGGNSTISTYSGTGGICPTCQPTQTACALVPADSGGMSSYSGDRNQNVYTSRISNGLIVRFKENAKPLSGALQRSFSLLVKNTLSTLGTTPYGSPSYYRILLGATSTNQAPTCSIAGGTATFPGINNCYLDIAVNPTTTLTQAITVNSTTATTAVNVLVAQIQSIPTGNNAPTFTGLQALAVINGDSSNPSVASPDFVTADNSNPDVLTPYSNLTPITAGEEYDPTVDGPPDPTTTNIFTPKIGVPAIFTPKIGTVANSSPAIATPTIFTPKITSIFTPKIDSVQIANPTIVNTIFTPKIFTPKIFTPKIVSPDIFTPKITDLSDSGGSNSITDYSWQVANRGNTSASYDTTEFPKAAGVSCCPASCSAKPSSCTVTASNPAGPNCSVCQLVQQKVYESPVNNRIYDPVSGTGFDNATCDATVQQAYTTVANIADPAFSTGTGGTSASDPTNSTLALSPGEGNRVTLRVVAPPVTQTVQSFKTVATSFSPDTGQGSPASSLTITTGALPVAIVGQSYTSTTLSSLGGFGTTMAWSVPADPTNPVAVTLPVSPALLQLPVTPLTLSQGGQISTGVITAQPNSYTVSMQVQDAAVPPSLDVQQITLDVNSFTITSVNVAIANEVGSTSYMKAGDTAMVSVTVSSVGPATATSVVPTLTVNTVAGGTQGGAAPVVNCGAPNPTSATLTSMSETQMFNFTCTAISGNGYITFTANATGQYVNSPAATVTATATAVSEPAATPSGTPPNVIVDTTLPFLAFQPTTSTQSAPGWYNAPVVVPYTTSDNLSGQYQVNATPPATSNGLNAQGNGAMTLTTEGNAVTGTLTLSDFAKNSLMFTSTGFNIDETKPTISGAATPVPDGFGWNNTPVTVTFTCTDPNPNNGPAGQQSGIAALPGGCTPPILLSAEGNNLSATGTAVDNAANSTSTTVTGIMIDTTPPTIVGSPDRPANANHWYNAPVTVSFVCVDPNPVHGPALQQSGIATCSTPTALSADGANQSVPGATTDKATNAAGTTVTGINIDQTPPVITPNSTYTPNVWTNQSVTVTFTCTDNLSGPAAVNPVITGIPGTGSTLTYSQAGLASTATVTLTANTPVSGTTLSANCQDLAGNNAAPVSFGPILIDTTPPVITATANLNSSNGAPYTAGTWTNQSVVVTFSCTDALSGVQSGSLTGNTSYGAQGTYTANGSCRDIAGNSVSESFGPVEIDTTTPSVMITAPMQTTYILNQQISPSFGCPDNSGGDTVTCTATPSASPYAATPAGLSTFTVNGVDQAGNSASGSVSYLVTYKFTGFQVPLQNAVMTPYPSGNYTPSDSGYFASGATIPVAWQLQDAANTVISDPTSLTSIMAYPNASCTGPASGTGTTLYSTGSNTSAFGFANNTFTFNWNTTGTALGCYNLVVNTNDTAQWSTIVHLTTPTTSFAVGATPYAIAFDGTNMWVPGYKSNNVTKLLASTGAVVGTYPVGNGPDGVAFDGTNIWVANTTDGTVTELSTTGATLGTFHVGSQPWGIAFDSAKNIWVTNRSSNSVTKLAAGSGALVGTYPVGPGPYGIAFDGTNMWVANDYNSTVTELVASTGAMVGTFAVGASPVGVTFDGTNIWVADQTGAVGTVTKLGPTGSVIGTYPAGPAPNDILFDGTNIWVTNNSSNTVTQLVASTGSIVGTYAVGTGPYGIAFDGTNIWATVPGNNSVTELPVF